MLAGGPERDLAALDLGDDGVRLQRVLVDGRERVVALDDDVGVREDGLDLAAVDAGSGSRRFPPGAQLAEAVEEARAEGPSCSSGASGASACVDRADDRQLLVVDVDAVERGLGGRLVLGRDGRDRLAREADAVDRDDGPVLIA